jgi:hypothetical protein
VVRHICFYNAHQKHVFRITWGLEGRPLRAEELNCNAKYRATGSGTTIRLPLGLNRPKREPKFSPLSRSELIVRWPLSPCIALFQSQEEMNLPLLLLLLQIRLQEKKTDILVC